MQQHEIDRINELARKKKAGELTPTEAEEQKQLREKYIQEFRRATIATLDNTYILRPDGTKEKLKDKSGKPEQE